MSRRPRLATGGLAYHVLNRRGGLSLFNKPADYAGFEKVLAEFHRRTGIHFLANCLIPTHRHLLWSRRDRSSQDSWQFPFPFSSSTY
jgi:hypothetical protein